MVYAGGNLDRERFLLFHPRRAVAGRAGFRDDLSGAVTLRARLLDGEESLLHAHLALTFAGRAGSRLRAGLGPRSLAGVAILVSRNANPGLGAARRLFQRDLQVVTQVGSAVYRRTTAAGLVEDIPEDIAESVGEAREAGGPAASHARARVDSRVAKTVIGRALAGVGQDFVRLFCLLEKLFGLGVIRVAIRMMLHCEASIRFLDGLLVGVAVDAQYFVVVTLCHLQADSSRAKAESNRSLASRFQLGRLRRLAARAALNFSCP